MNLPNKLMNITVWNTSRCNFSCKYCFVYRLNKIIGENMTKETADALIHFAQHNLAQNGSIWFFGGEPFVDWESMKYIVEKAHANRVINRFGATTNMYLVNENVIDWLKKYNFSLLASIDGTDKIHNKYRVLRDGSGTWDICWKNLQLVMKKTGHVPQIRWTIQTTDPEVLEETPEAFKWFLKQGFNNIAMDFVYEVEIDEDLLKLIKQLMEKLSQILDTCYSQEKWVFSMMVRDAFHAITNKVRTSWRNRCGLAQGDIGVAPNGKIYPCHRFVASTQYQVGDVFTGFNPTRLRLNEEWQKMPPYSQEPELCLKCSFKNACHGGCLAANCDVCKDIHVVPKTFCLIKQLNVEVFKPLILKHQGFIQKNLHPTGRECIE